MKDRIRQLMESQNLSQQSFAEKLQLSPASLSNIFNDRTKPTLNHVEAIQKSFPNINLKWLIFGTGNMFVNTTDPDEIKYSDVHKDDAEGNLFIDFSSSTPSVSEPANSFKQEVLPVRRADLPTAKIIDKPQRQITEIRLFFDDHTWETFVPKK